LVAVTFTLSPGAPLPPEGAPPPTMVERADFQTMTILSSPPDAKKEPVGANADAVQAPWCPWSV
jgi:hypothetical protein